MFGAPYFIGCSKPNITLKDLSSKLLHRRDLMLGEAF